MRRARAVGTLFGCLLLVGACGEDRKLTDGDCALIENRLSKAWRNDGVEAVRDANADKLLPFVRDEEDRQADAWMKKCRELVGRRVSEDELACLMKVETLDDVYACAGR